MSKAEKTIQQLYVNWMLARDALKHVQNVENCDGKKARRQIRAALLDGQLHARWEDYRPPLRDGSTVTVVDNDSLDAYGELWKKIYIDWDSSKAIDPDRVRRPNELTKRPVSEKKLRTLLLLRRDMERLWPLQTCSPDHPPLTRPFNESMAKGESRKARKQRQIAQAANELIGAGKTPTSCGTWGKFEKILREKLKVSPGERGYGPDTIQNIVRPLLRA